MGCAGPYSRSPLGGVAVEERYDTDEPLFGPEGIARLIAA